MGGKVRGKETAKRGEKTEAEFRKRWPTDQKKGADEEEEKNFWVKNFQIHPSIKEKGYH